MEYDTATEMSSSTVDQYRLQRANAPAIPPNPLLVPRARGRRNTISTEFPCRLEQPITRAGLESAFALLEYTDKRPADRITLKSIEALAKAASSTKVDHDLFKRNPNPQRGFALESTFRRNGQIVSHKFAEGRYLCIIIDGLKEGKLNYLFDMSGLKLAPPRMRLVRVLKKPREMAYYVTWRELKGEGDIANFVLWVDGEVLRTKRYWRNMHGR